jgi:hypothetical protein
VSLLLIYSLKYGKKSPATTPGAPSGLEWQFGQSPPITENFLETPKAGNPYAVYDFEYDAQSGDYKRVAFSDATH